MHIDFLGLGPHICLFFPLTNNLRARAPYLINSILTCLLYAFVAFYYIFIEHYSGGITDGLALMGIRSSEAYFGLI